MPNPRLKSPTECPMTCPNCGWWWCQALCVPPWPGPGVCRQRQPPGASRGELGLVTRSCQGGERGKWGDHLSRARQIQGVWCGDQGGGGQGAAQPRHRHGGHDVPPQALPLPPGGHDRSVASKTLLMPHYHAMSKQVSRLEYVKLCYVIIQGHTDNWQDDYAKLMAMLQAKEARATCTAQSTSTPTCPWPSRWGPAYWYNMVTCTSRWCRWYRGGRWRAGTCCTATACPGSSGCSTSCRVIGTFDFGYCASSKLFWQSKNKIFIGVNDSD